MPGLDVPNLSVLSPGAGQPSGLLMGLDPEYQAKQLALRQAQNQYDVQRQIIGQLGGPDPFTGPGPTAAASPSGSSQAASTAASASGSPSPMVPFRNAIASIESQGSGGYNAVGPTLKNGDFAVGNYGIMASNVPAWTKDVLGTAMRPEEFRASPQAQDAVFDAKFGGYLRQTGSPQDAASMWFTGQPLQRGANRADVLGTTGSGYVSKFMAALGGQRPQGMQGAAGASSPAGSLPTMARADAPQAQADADVPLPPERPVQVAENGTSDAPPAGQHPFAPPQPERQPPVAPRTVTGPAAVPDQPSAATASAGAALPTPQAGMNAVPVRTALQTAVAADPTLGGFLGGQFLGDPAGAINYLRRQQQLSGFAGYKEAADGFKARADNLEKTVERLDQMTPEQRNARDPAAVQYERDRATFNAQAPVIAQNSPLAIQGAQNRAAATAQGKLDVESSPQAMRAKGQEAEAAAAGREQGQNSPSAIGARASAAAATAEATQSGNALGKLPQLYANAATAATKQNAIISDMLDQAGQFNMGQYADKEQGFNASMSALGHAMHVDTSDIDGKVAAYQQYVKLGGNLTRQAMKDTGGRTGGIQEMQFIANTLPSPSTSPLGFKGIAAFLQGSNDYDIAKQQAADAYGKANGTLRGFEGQFTSSVSPAATLLHRLQQDQPEMFATTVARLKQSPAGQAVLRKAVSGLQYLGGLGVGG